MHAAYYNEIDPFAAQWLRNLITAGHIAPGDVDERDIRDVRPDDLRGYTQCHFFAGIGVWSYALRRVGWPDSRPVWTGSCPCQPFSVCGLGGGFDDERHLWPFFHHLIAQRRPETVFGEQVASKHGLGWLDLVHSDMEGTGYAFAAVDLCAAGVGAPHIRQRLWFVADAGGKGLAQRERIAGVSGGAPRTESRQAAVGNGICDAGGLADTERERRERGQGFPSRGINDRADAGRVEDHDGLVCGDEVGISRVDLPGPTNGFWRDADWLGCRDGKWRPVEPGTFPLAHGAASRVGRLRAYGNAINAEAAIQIIAAFQDAEALL
jgi:DNA (cytosine-5)-methyltransferase 1